MTERAKSKRMQEIKTKEFWEMFIERWWEADKESGRLPIWVESIQDLQHVYFLQIEDDGPIKIGRSIDVDRRHSSLQGCNTHRIHLRAVIPNGGRRVENFLHRIFLQHRLKREWFLPTPDLQDVINIFSLKA